MIESMNSRDNPITTQLNRLLGPDSRLFSYLILPDSYLMVAGILSGVAASLFLVLNVMALQCLLTQCAALQEDSNNLQAWLTFEGITVFFVGTSVACFRAFFRRKREQDPD